MKKLQCGECGSHELDLVWIGECVCEECGAEQEFSYQESMVAAEAGDPFAQCIIGAHHASDVEGIPKDHAIAFAWYKRASDNGYAPGDRQVGYAYEHGLGVEQSHEKAMDMYKKAAAHGDIRAIFNVGIMYQFRFETNLEEAVRCYRTAAEAGLTRAQSRLGHCYLYGTGVAQDYEQALEWLRTAGDNGDANALQTLGSLYEFGEGVEEDPEKAAEYYLASAELGDAEAQCCIGYCYETGIGVDIDPESAFEWYLESARNGYARGMNNLGDCYMEGFGVAEDLEQAEHWFREAVEHGFEDAEKNLEKLRQKKPKSLWNRLFS